MIAYKCALFLLKKVCQNCSCCQFTEYEQFSTIRPPSSGCLGSIYGSKWVRKTVPKYCCMLNKFNKFSPQIYRKVAQYNNTAYENVVDTLSQERSLNPLALNWVTSLAPQNTSYTISSKVGWPSGRFSLHASTDTSVGSCCYDPRLELVTATIGATYCTPVVDGLRWQYDKFNFFVLTPPQF